jgi:hypothetical protein
VPLDAEEIRRNLAEFAARWGGYHGTERAEAQTFLNELLACFGTDRLAAGARFEQLSPGGFMDMIWPRVCIVEMKRPSEAPNLAAHRQQALDYWTHSGSPEEPAPRWVMLCAFHRFEVWEPGAIFTQPRIQFELVDLPDYLDALLFLSGQEPVFLTTQAELTREAASAVTQMLAALQERRAADPDTLRDFALQCVWCMFAEGLHMLPSHLFTRLVDGLCANPQRSSADDLGALFRYLNDPETRPTHGLYAGTPYVDGALFAESARVHLNGEELELLRQACGSPWNRVEPAIFGSLLEGALRRERQWSLGAHYTAEADILKIVLPTVVEPWRDRVEACETLPDVHAAQNDLMSYVVLDPACGSGNFLYVAYRELRRIEADLSVQAVRLRREAGLSDQEALAFFPLTNMRGLEIDPFAVKLARVTLWMGHKLAVQELDLNERVLPLVDLSGIQRADALRVGWPRANAIIGNPPYHGSQRIRRELGDDYADWLAREFGIGIQDYAVYWFRKAHDALPSEGRAGLVATNSISQGRARQASLEWIVENGGVVTNAVSTQDWSGEAAVDVSIVNWIKHPQEAPQNCVLDGVAVSAITPALRAADLDVSRALRLAGNGGKAFQGPQPVGRGFVLEQEEALDLLDRGDAKYTDVVRPYLVGEDILQTPDQAPTRYIIDFGTRSLEQAIEYPAALAIVRDRVKPFRDQNRRKTRREKWWLLGELVPAMRAALRPLQRYKRGRETFSVHLV